MGGRYLLSAFSIAFFVLELSPAEAIAQKVGLLHHGPTDKIVTLENSNAFNESGHIPLPVRSPILGTDFTATPDDGFLVATKGKKLLYGQRSGADQGRVFEPGERIDAMAVERFNSDGMPVRIWAGHRETGKLFVYSLKKRQILWNRFFRIGERPLHISDIVAISPTKLAISLNRKTANISLIDILQFSGSYPNYGNLTTTHRITNHPPLSRSTDFPTTLIRDVYPVKSMIVNDDHQLVAATPTELLWFDNQYELQSRQNIPQTTQLFGELQSISFDSNQNVLVSLAEPGVWTRSHQNHEIARLTRQNERLEVDTKSNFLSAAPRAISPLETPMATGHFGYQPGTQSTENVDLVLKRFAIHSTSQEEGDISLEAHLRNEGSNSVSIDSVKLVVSKPNCPPETSGEILWKLHSLYLEADETKTVDTSIDASTLDHGEWCARISYSPGSETTNYFDQKSHFQVTEDLNNPDAGGDIRSLDPPIYAGEGRWPSNKASSGRGCGCETTSSRSIPPLRSLLLFLASFLGLRHLFPLLKPLFNLS